MCNAINTWWNRLEIPRWERYKIFFNITVFRYLVLWFTVVPVLASLLRGFQVPLTVTFGERSMTLPLELPFSWQLLWISSFFFFLALALYFIRCPGFVSQYNSYDEYASYQHDPRWLVRVAKDLLNDKGIVEKFTSRMVTKGFVIREHQDSGEFDNKSTDGPLVFKNQTIIRYEHNGVKWYFPMPPNTSIPENGSERAVFWEIFACYSGSRWRSRLLILVFLLISGLFFLCVLMPHIWAGFMEVWKIVP